MPSDRVVELSEYFLQSDDVELAGLGARDSLRLEAGLCLYGSDLKENITPVEAGLTWTIGKTRRISGGFLGAEKILPQIKDGAAKRRIGLTIDGAPARAHAEIHSGGELVGEVTSGCPSPSLKQNIAMGYIKNGLHKVGTVVQVKVRNKMREAVVTKMPFVPARYHRVEKK